MKETNRRSPVSSTRWRRSWALKSAGFAALSFMTLLACSGDEPADTSVPRVGGMEAAANRAGVATSGTGEANAEPNARPAGLVAGVPTTKTVAAPATPRWTPLGTLLGKTLRQPNAHAATLANAPRYDLTVDVDVDLMTYVGSERLKYTNRTDARLDRVVFLLYPNSPELADGGTRNLVISKVLVDGKPAVPRVDGPTMVVELPTPLATGSAVELDIDFKGRIYRLPRDTSDLTKIGLDQALQMLGGSDDKEGGYGVFGHSDGVISLGLWYPVVAAHDGKDWDLNPGGSIGDVSHFEVSHVEASITAPSDVAVVATGVEVDAKKAGATKPGTTTRRVWAGAVRELTIQMSRDYESATTQVGDVTVTSWFKRANRNAGDKVLGYAAAALRVFEKEHGPYPYTELDVAEAPLIGGAAGVEFPGLVTIATMLYGDPTVQIDNPSLAQMLDGADLMKDTLEFVVAHEVAHQWWNAVVGSDSKRHPFVDEALANFSAVRYFEVTHGKAAAERQRSMQLKLPFQIAMATGAKDRPVDLPAEAFTNTTEYAAVVYGKGALFFEALREAIGASAFDQALADYYTRFSFRLADPKDLLGAFEAAAGSKSGEVQRLAQRWLHGTHAAEDMGDMDVMGLLGAVLPEGPESADFKKLVGLAQQLGDVDSFSELVNGLLDPNGPLGGKLDTALGELLGLDADGQQMLNGALRGVQRFTQRGPDAGLEQGLLDMVGEMVEDPRLKQFLNGTGQLLEMLREPDPAPRGP